MRDSAYPEVEKALLLWLKKARSMNLPVSGPLLTEKALTFADQLNCPGFACSNGWLSRFKARYGIVGKVVCALAQPLDQGIIRSVKQIYRKNLLRRMLIAMESAKTYSIDLLGAIHLLAHSWMQVQPATIRNCFARAQFKMPEEGNDENMEDNEDGEDTEDCESLLVEVLERQGEGVDKFNFGTFRDVDGDVLTSPDFSDSDIVAAIAPRPDSSESEEEGDVEVDDGPSLSEAARAVTVMRAFAEKRGLMDRLARGLTDFEDAVVEARPPRRQVKITDFFAACP
ncbi:hypothetical protein HPB51_019214 [Rhipicephalus microplus]|uniref:HTH CENPB-type domain-containing protein n=1 Tax=Rhipicephalus microplus TaxID=6941 RepID=A0A9J6DAQ4_RHIMP|nr:hypothetical protein HPB51_015643 [Rhipicephalus microplus]KAH8019347.1 hypothetical protein HPB51_019214 [Rhipicephalus microplus]